MNWQPFLGGGENHKIIFVLKKKKNKMELCGIYPKHSTLHDMGFS
jgi:hypothetical protein